MGTRGTAARPVFRAGVLLQCLAQRLVLHSTLGRELRNVGRQERERMLRVALVLREVKRHAADEPPLRVSLAEVSLYPARMMLDLGADKRVELRPPGRQHVGSGTHTPASGAPAGPETPARSRRAAARPGCHRFARPPAFDRAGSDRDGRNRAEPKCRRQARLKLGRRQVHKTLRRAFGKSGMNSLADRAIRKGSVGDVGFSNVKMALGR